jgi:hypothetical protein
MVLSYIQLGYMMCNWHWKISLNTAARMQQPKQEKSLGKTDTPPILLKNMKLLRMWS